ncbi:DUF6773 family protein [Clostridium beijerinckii]|uniref:Membrane protein n=2 Tax=Clostridium beijerinckii TaxID=1520 RepID=A0AAE5H3W4_CLOBE|nr:DUF6773 family protein [Clostridium beijerinckii]MBC2459155.1 hypothetical protein [Clostridium beijerinckii]MBC2476655.1 hypothetical protein [Clostridium beijerinckii]NOV61126.1 putative membrane protein [Clostridium beijerinckii]NOV69381.1 putative membrane protein [Clostridium beijerinckii]NOW33009.1 putative membrane protein [Clostridium beijerinckii]
MNKKIDERQQQEFYKCEHMAFHIMFSVSVIVIVIQMLFMKAAFQQVLGETVILACGGISMILSCLKSGLWSYNNNEPSVKSNLIYSIICSVVATLLFAIIIYTRAGIKVMTPTIIGGFFGGIFILGFIVLTLLGQVSKNTKKKIENKYKDI